MAAGCGRYWVCDPPDPELARLPQRLSETGLDEANVVAYTPRFPLWSDGAEKDRFIYLPSPPDTSNPDEWVFPIGTKVWKQFSVGGARLETRLIERTTAGWLAQSYAWLADDSDAIASPDGIANARNTGHDIPGAGECLACHGGRQSFILGYSQIQLATEPPPGDDRAVAALGYLHANCSHCHNQTRPDHDGARCFDPENSFDFTLPVGVAAVEDTPAYRTIEREHIGESMLSKMSARGFFKQMPPLATNQVDQAGVATIRAWLAEMP